MLAIEAGPLSIENAEATIDEVERRVDQEVPLLLTSDEHPDYETAIEWTCDESIPPKGGPGRPRIGPKRTLTKVLAYATVHKQRQGRRVVAVD